MARNNGRTPSPNQPPRRAKAALALARGANLIEACKAGNVSRRQLYRWRRDPKFQALVDEFRSVFTQRSLSVLSRASTKAAAELVRLLRHGDGKIRFAAARSILDQVSKLSEVAARRVEQLADDGNKPTYFVVSASDGPDDRDDGGV